MWEETDQFVNGDNTQRVARHPYVGEMQRVIAELQDVIIHLQHEVELLQPEYD
jgi:hypothetical protein